MIACAEKLKAPFPWFGGKRLVAPIVWQAFGNVPNYVEPFFGSGAVLLGRPHAPGIETANDKDGFVCNAWRAIQSDPEAVAKWADQPVNECDLHARHTWLVPRREELTDRLMGDPDYYDPKIAGWWLWGISCWIGGGFCSGEGPWQSIDGRLVKGNAGKGVMRKLPHLGNAGRGVNRQHSGLAAYIQALAARLRYVRVCCDDWTRVLGPSVTYKHGLTGVFLDPPYAQAGRDARCYSVDEIGISDAVREWAIANGDNPLLRIVLCGYEGEHEMPDTWRKVAWKAHGGMGSQGNGIGRENAYRERLWLSPHCVGETLNLFGEAW